MAARSSSMRRGLRRDGRAAAGAVWAAAAWVAAATAEAVAAVWAAADAIAGRKSFSRQIKKGAMGRIAPFFYCVADFLLPCGITQASMPKNRLPLSERIF